MKKTVFDYANKPAADLWKDKDFSKAACGYVGACSGGGGGGSVASVFGRTGAISAQLGDYDISQITGSDTLVLNNATYSNPSWITGLAWSKIMSAPAFITGNQSIALSGDVSGTGTTAITTVIGSGKVTNSMLAGSIAFSKLIGTDITTVGTIVAGTWQGTAIADSYIASAAAWNAKGSGSVTTLSVVSANGFAGTVANATTTPAITLTTSITGLLKGNGTAISAATDADITGRVLTGFVSSAGSVSSTDTILQAIQKIDGNTALLTGAIIYKGTWNATTNSPTLTSGVGTKGYLYKVSTAGSTNLDGITQWNIGDAAVFNGTTWDKLDGTATEVLSVNGLVGAVALTGTSNRITISGANVFDIAATYVGQTSITTLGTITTGVWNGTAIANANLANSAVTVNGSSISLGGSATISAAPNGAAGGDLTGTYPNPTLVGKPTGTIVGTSDTQTLTNKRINPRISSVATATTHTINGDTTDMSIITALASNLTIAAPTGTPVQGQQLLIRIKDNGTARTLTFNSIFRASTDLAFPGTTVISQTMYIGFVYNSTDTKWDMVSLLNNFA